MTPDNLTPKQKEVLDGVFNLLYEHFDSFAVVYDIADADDRGAHVTGGQWSGGEAVALGMLRLQAAKIEARHVAEP